jgi:hypothetical protein
MAHASPIITSTNAGELAPLIEGRSDLARYFSGCKRLENFITTVQGPAVRRGGFRYVAATKTQSERSWLLKFEFNATQFFVLEFGDEYVRFFTDHGVLESSPGTPYEIVSPYTLADLTMPNGTCALDFVQSGDVLYIANRKRTYAPRTLTRVTNTNWVFALYQPNNGPFLEQNTTTTTIEASAQSGSITLTASAALFAATDVGRLVRLDALNLDLTRPWETGKEYTAGNIVRSDGKTYSAQNSATSGTAPPTHERGTAFDGLTGVEWDYINSGYGIARITAFTSATEVSAEVVYDPLNGLNTLPEEVTATPTTRWQLGAWSATTEYPAVVTFFRSRLWWAGQLRLWGSVPDDFENMAADFYNEVRADNAISRIITGQDVNDIEWIIGTDKLVVGTGGGEFVAGEITSSEPIGPANFAVIPQSLRRARSVKPSIIGSALLFLQRAGRKLLSLSFSIEADRLVSRDQTVLSDRVTRSGIVQMAYQSEPYSLLWQVRADGKLIAFTFDQEQDVSGWHRHPVGGTGVVVESIVTGPTPDGGREELWAIVRRTINGTTRRYVEYMERPWEGGDDDGTEGDEQEDAFYVDSGLTYDGAAATTISGLGHLEGETVQILADGARQPDKTVSGGQITLSRAASKVHVGLQYVSRLVPMRLEAGGNIGTSQGKIKRIHELVVRFVDTLGGKIGMYRGTLDPISLRSPSTPMGAPEAIASGDHHMEFPGDYDREALIEIVQDAPLPMTVAAIIPELRTYG